MRAGHCSDQGTRRGSCDDPRKKICIQKGFDNTKVVYGSSRELIRCLHLLDLTVSESGPARETERSETQIGIRVLEESFSLVVG